ncbi:DUF2914 domain-containing protein [Thermodesulfobacteriota bacterium]
MLKKINTVKTKIIVIAVLMIAFTQILCIADETPPADTEVKPKAPVLKVAVLCEDVRASKTPINEAVVFSSSLGRLFCFTNFDPVYEETYIFHKYYFKDKFRDKQKLKLTPPSWGAKSDIKLRETDKGPWRVDITDADGKVFHSIRFSITD